MLAASPGVSTRGLHVSSPFLQASKFFLRNASVTFPACSLVSWDISQPLNPLRQFEKFRCNSAFRACTNSSFDRRRVLQVEPPCIQISTFRLVPSDTALANSSLLSSSGFERCLRRCKRANSGPCRCLVSSKTTPRNAKR